MIAFLLRIGTTNLLVLFTLCQFMLWSFSSLRLFSLVFANLIGTSLSLVIIAYMVRWGIFSLFQSDSIIFCFSLIFYVITQFRSLIVLSNPNLWQWFLCNKLWCLSISLYVMLWVSWFCHLFCLTIVWLPVCDNFPFMNVLFAFSSRTFSSNLLPYVQIIVSIKSDAYHFPP